jgi:hypothetical protein
VIFANDPYIVSARTWVAQPVTPELNYTVVIWQEHLFLCWDITDYAYGLTMFENDDIVLIEKRIVLGMGIKYKTLFTLD